MDIHDLENRIADLCEALEEIEVLAIKLRSQQSQAGHTAKESRKLADLIVQWSRNARKPKGGLNGYL